MMKALTIAQKRMMALILGFSMVLLFTGVISAAEITWSAETVLTDMSSGTEVITDGDLVIAVNDGGGAATTINGVAFQADGSGLGFASDSSGTLDGNSAGIYGTLLDSHGYNGAGDGGVITLDNLEIGQDYLLQLFMIDKRGCCSGRIMIYGDNSGDTSNDYVVSETLNTAYMIVGEFTADAVTQDVMIEIQGILGYGHLNGYQLRTVDLGPLSPVVDPGYPEDVSANAADDVTFTVVAANPFAGHESDVSYQWKKDGVDLSNGATAHGSTVSGCTSSTLAISNVQSEDIGGYSCHVTNTYGNTESADSRTAQLSVLSGGGLIGHWPLDDDSTPAVAQDISGAGNDGAITGASYVSDGSGGKAVRFDGSGDLISIPSAAFDSITTEFSIAFLANGAVPSQESFVFQAWQGGTRTVGLSLPWTNSLIYDYGLGCCGYRLTYGMSAEMVSGQWNLWVLTRDSVSGEVSAYCNGVFLSSVTDFVSIPDFDSFYIGAHNGNADYCYNGMLKDFRLYDYAMDETEAMDLYFSIFGYKPMNPQPRNESQNTSINPELSWSGFSAVDSYRVHFGQSQNPPFVVEQGTTTYQPATLENETTYYWRIDSVINGEVTTGDLWSFTTVMLPPNPDDLGFNEIVFIKRKPYSSDHYYTDITNGTSADRFLAENGIYIYNLETTQVRPVVTAADLPGGTGFIGKFTLSFDATKLLFDFRQNTSSGFRIWEVNVDGTGLRQITTAPADEAEKVARWGGGFHTDDIHPCYLPNGKIMFSSTRCEHRVLCGGGLVAANLHIMDPDDPDSVEQLTRTPLSEFCPMVLDDGRVLYHRWEYIDKGARVSKTLWSMNPNGSMSQEVYGLSEDSTTVYMYPQPVPGGNQILVCAGTCHFPQGGCVGNILLIDLKVDNRIPLFEPGNAVTNITPSVYVGRRDQPGWRFVQENGSVIHDQNGQSGHLYTHPYPVSEKQFLVSYKVNASDHYKNVPGAYQLYLIDTSGNHVFIYKDEDDTVSCWHPTPLVSRDMPTEVYSFEHPTFAANEEALCIVSNVYEGMEGVAPGEVKYLRINESVPRYWDTRKTWSDYDSASWSAALWPRVQWGIVPVEADGSAYFTVPADRAIFFQALDENFRELQRERTYVNYKPGEIRSCVGCHERSGQAPRSIAHETPLALKRAPSTPGTQPGETEPKQVIHYPTDIQPIFDAKCISCHGSSNPDAGLNLTGSLTYRYSTSYEQLMDKQLAGPSISEFIWLRGGDHGNINGAYLPPKSLGSHTSTLASIVLTEDSEGPHYQLLNETQLAQLFRWIDSNYQFYGTYYGRHHWDHQSDPDFRRKPTFEEAISPLAPSWHN